MEEELNSEFLLCITDPLFRSKHIENASEGLRNLVNLMQNGKYLEVLKLNPWPFESEERQSSPFHISVTDKIKNHLSSNDSMSCSHVEMYCTGISSLQLFIQRNWLGLPDDPAMKIFDFQLDEESDKEILLDGESYFPTVKNLPLLLIAKIILGNLNKDCFKFKLSDWWQLRYLYVHQRILEESSPTLHSIFLDVVGRLPEMEKLLDGKIVLSSSLQMEIGYTFLLYGEIQKSKNHFERAAEISKFSIEWTGALGKRTFYQQKPLAQLTVRVRSSKLSSEEVGDDFTPTQELPTDVKLEDDTRLNKIAFLDADDNILPDLPPIYQALLLAQATILEKFHPKDELLAEELSPLVNCILAYPKIWSLHASSLLLRSKFESSQRRAMERAMTQLQELVDSLPKSGNESAHRRLEYFYISKLPLEWELQGSLADAFSSLGANSSALDIYLRLQMWDRVISCYQLLEMKHKAEEIVRKELAKSETPKLWCLLGDCTDDVQYYEKAWEVSKHTSARAQRDWAYYYYYKKKYSECIPHFQKSLAINSLQESIWIRLAFSAMEVEDWEIAAGAYRRYCSLNSESFEAWNNVAKCYVKLGQKARAWRALQEAVKCQYENWKVWDNLMVVSIDCCEYDEAIRSYNRVLDLKEKHVDHQVLRILVQAVSENKEDNYGDPVRRLTVSVRKLLDRLTSQVTDNAQVWEIYADLVSATEKDAQLRVAQLAQKALRSAIQVKNWEKDVTSCTTTLKTCAKFINWCLEMLANKVSDETIQLAASAKLSVRSSLSQVRLCYPMEVPESVKEQLNELEKLQNDLIALVAQISSS